MNAVRDIEFIPTNTKPVYVEDALKGLPKKNKSTLASGKRMDGEK